MTEPRPYRFFCQRCGYRSRVQWAFNRHPCLDRLISMAIRHKARGGDMKDVLWPSSATTKRDGAA
jgi:hypothetical protein